MHEMQIATNYGCDTFTQKTLRSKNSTLKKSRSGGKGVARFSSRLKNFYPQKTLPSKKVHPNSCIYDIDSFLGNLHSLLYKYTRTMHIIYENLYLKLD